MPLPGRRDIQLGRPGQFQCVGQVDRLDHSARDQRGVDGQARRRRRCGAGREHGRARGRSPRPDRQRGGRGLRLRRGRVLPARDRRGRDPDPSHRRVARTISPRRRDHRPRDRWRPRGGRRRGRLAAALDRPRRPTPPASAAMLAPTSLPGVSHSSCRTSCPEESRQHAKSPRFSAPRSSSRTTSSSHFVHHNQPAGLLFE